MQTQITYRCDKKNFLGNAVVGDKGKSFVCAVCGLKIFVNLEKLEFGSHGYTKDAIKHTLLTTQEVGVEK